MNKLFFSGNQIPEQKIGKWQVKHVLHRKGEKITIVSMRNSIFDGRLPKTVTLPSNTFMHELIGPTGVWMRDSPQEIEQARLLVQDFHGEVLIAGLGLGVVLSVLPEDVTSAIVVENSKEVIDMVWEHVYLPERDMVVVTDFYNFARQMQPNNFDFAYIDIWQPTGEHVLTDHVIPLRRILNGKIEQSKIRCWGESEMWGQVKFHLYIMIEAPEIQKSYADNLDQVMNYDKVKAPYYKWFFENNPTKQEAYDAIEDFIDHPLKWFKE